MHPTETPQTRASFFAGFRDHPASVGETYFGHMRFALKFSSRLFIAGGAALVHAFIPPLCETTASRQVKAMAQMLENRH